MEAETEIRPALSADSRRRKRASQAKVRSTTQQCAESLGRLQRALAATARPFQQPQVTRLCCYTVPACQRPNL